MRTLSRKIKFLFDEIVFYRHNNYVYEGIITGIILTNNTEKYIVNNQITLPEWKIFVNPSDILYDECKEYSIIVKYLNGFSKTISKDGFRFKVGDLVSEKGLDKHDSFKVIKAFEDKNGNKLYNLQGSPNIKNIKEEHLTRYDVNLFGNHN